MGPVAAFQTHEWLLVEIHIVPDYPYVGVLHISARAPLSGGGGFCARPHCAVWKSSTNLFWVPDFHASQNGLVRSTTFHFLTCSNGANI